MVQVPVEMHVFHISSNGRVGPGFGWTSSLRNKSNEIIKQNKRKQADEPGNKDDVGFIILAKYSVINIC